MSSLEESIKLAVESLGVNLYDIVTTRENDRDIFRVIVTSKDGISLDKCAQISRLISPILDVEEPMSGVYNLEVSSPGIERRLKKIEHYKASIGELVKIKTFDKEIVRGELISADDEKIVISSEDENKEINYTDISSAATYFEW